MIDSECIPCILKQAIRTYRILDYDEEHIIDRLRELTYFYSSLDWSLSAPEIYFEIFRWIKKDLGIEDPYRDVKRYWNSYILSHYDSLKNRVEDSSDPLYTSMKIALAGNIIDFGALESFNFEETLDRVLDMKLVMNDYGLLIDKLDNGGEMLYILDNAGEAALDKLFIETIIENYDISMVYVGVRDGAFINDVTLDDVREIGLDKLDNVEFIGLPVTLNMHLEYIRDGTYSKIFNDKDIVILKGQGNYELFYMYKGIFFLLMVKCIPVAKLLGVKIGDGILKYSS